MPTQNDKKDVWNELTLTAEGKTIRSENNWPGHNLENALKTGVSGGCVRVY